MVKVISPKKSKECSAEDTSFENIKESPAIKLPKTLAACADLYDQLRDERLAKDKEAAALKTQEEFVKAYLIDNIPKSEATGVAGKRAQVSVVCKSVPQVKDWDALYKHVLKTKDFSLLNRALNKKAVEERWNDKKIVPGVEAFDTVTLSLHKIK
jgi:hypothetical protein